MIRLLKIAVPPIAFAVAVVFPFENVPGSSVSVTAETVVTRFPYTSSTNTFTEGARATPAVPVVGVCCRINCDGAAGLMVMAPDVAVGSDSESAFSVYFPEVSRVRLLKRAIPF